MSSLTMVLALSALQRGDIRNNRVWLLTTALLGSLFIGGQVYEFTTFVREGLGYSTSPFSSAFFTLTGFHGVHVSLGIRDADVAAHLVVAWDAHQGAVGDRRDCRPVLALRRRGVDLHLHRHLPGALAHQLIGEP